MTVTMTCGGRGGGGVYAYLGVLGVRIWGAYWRCILGVYICVLGGGGFRELYISACTLRVAVCHCERLLGARAQKNSCIVFVRGGSLLPLWRQGVSF